MLFRSAGPIGGPGLSGDGRIDGRDGRRILLLGWRGLLDRRSAAGRKIVQALRLQRGTRQRLPDRGRLRERDTRRTRFTRVAGVALFMRIPMIAPLPRRPRFTRRTLAAAPALTTIAPIARRQRAPLDRRRRKIALQQLFVRDRDDPVALQSNLH